MFRQINVDPKDRKFQTIIWRANPQEEIRMYLLNTVTYGLTCSSFLSIRTLQQLAIDHEQEYPIAANVIRCEMYSDNVRTGVHTRDEAKGKVADLISIFKKAQMNLRKWCSNDIETSSLLPENMLAEDKVTMFSADTAVPLLGIAWHMAGDYFCFHFDSTPSDAITKRRVLSRIARIFDPLGWISPVTIVAKIIMQTLWRIKLTWDDPLSRDVAESWSRWDQGLPALKGIKVPRWTGYTLQTKVELHGFADASKTAYGAVIYLRLLHGNSVSTSLQLAKSKVAPVKTLSIPKLELCAALVLTRLAKHFLDSNKYEITDVHLWTDSADVLFWLRDQPSRWNVFIANRCSEIHTSLPSAFWHHVRSRDNPADVLSRGIEPAKLQDHAIWWNGPEFLTEAVAPWPKRQDELNFGIAHLTLAHTSKVTACENRYDAEKEISINWPPLVKYSVIAVVFRVSAYCLCFMAKISKGLRLNQNRTNNLLRWPFLKDSAQCSSRAINTLEIEHAKLFCCYVVQKSYFFEEYKHLLAGKILNKRHPLAALNPVIKNHLIRVGGRLANSLCDESSKHPIILPHSSAFTTLVVRQAHLRTLHGGTQLTLATVRKEYWIVRGRNEVRKIIKACVPCVRYAAQLPSQIMGDLPEARVRPAGPFEKTGVDYAGPVNVRLTKTREKGTLKGFVCIFVCMVTKAVHLELAEDYTSESFLAAFHRFTARRGHCKELFSDRGTNFVGADTLLRTMLENHTDFLFPVLHKLVDLGTCWHFNPPSAPHFGGLWEAAVKSLKHHLRRVIGDQVLTFSEFSTLLCRIEACLNSRPLISLSDDPSDRDVLTPAHFVIQHSSYLVPEPDVSSVHIPVGRRWQLLSQSLQHFWTRWRNEYLISLQKRNKWLQPKLSPKIGDLVLLRNENTPPGRWPLARVTETHPGKDGKVRVVTINTSNGSFRRPIVKLVLLPSEEQ